MFELARAGVDGVNVHTSERTFGKLFSFELVGTAWHTRVAPAYYGLLAFAQAAPPGSTLMRVIGSASSGPVHVWATRAPNGVERIVLINLGLRGGQTVLVRAGSSFQPAAVEWLAAPSLSSNDVTLGGQSFGPDTTTGELDGPQVTQPVANSGGGYRVWMPAGSAAIVTVPAA
jgi:hypothetical protein